MPDPVSGLVRTAIPLRRRQKTDCQVCAGPFKVDRIELSLGQTLGDTRQRVGAFTPGFGRIILVEAANVDDILPELAEGRVRLELRVNELRPLLCRSRSDTPVHGSLVDHLRPLLDPRENVTAQPLLVQAVEETGFDRAAERDRRGALVPELERPLSVPGRHEVERLVRYVLDAFAFEMGIPVVDVDELRPALVGACGDGAREVLLAESRGQIDDLAFLHVGAEVHDQIRVTLEERRHREAMLAGPRKASGWTRRARSSGSSSHRLSARARDAPIGGTSKSSAAGWKSIASRSRR